MSDYPIAIIGAGAIGLAAAAHIIERGDTPILFEAGATIGSHIQQWGHVRMFSPFQYVVDPAAVRLLDETGWQALSPDYLPTGRELITHYLEPLSQLPAIQDTLHLNHRVTAISRAYADKMKDTARDNQAFVIEVETPNGVQRFNARAVIDTSGVWSQPNPLGANGMPALGETELQSQLDYGIPDVSGNDRLRYINQRVAVVGGGHSAIQALISLADLKQSHPDTQILWVLRNGNLENRLGGGDDDALPARGALGSDTRRLIDNGQIELVSSFPIDRVQQVDDTLILMSVDASLAVDRVIVATGARPNLKMLRELRVLLDTSLEAPPALAPLIDPNIHSCGTVPPHGEAELRHPETNFYIAGIKSYGRAPTFLLMTGYEQVRSIVAALFGDMEAARQVQLELPETGVCGTSDASDGCCASPTQTTVGLDLISIRHN